MVAWKQYTPFSGYLSRLPVQVSELVQLDPGVLALSSIDVRGRDSFVIHFKTEARSVWTMVPESEWVGFLVPISWSGDYLFNGWAATSNSIFQLDGRHDYHVVAERRDAVTVGVRRSALTQAVASLSGRDSVAEPHMHRRIEVPHRLKRRLLSILWKLIAGASETDSKGAILKMPRTLENDMISAVADWLIDLDDLEDRGFLGSRSDLKIVRDAMDAMRQTQPPRMSLAELCRATGVKKSRLHNAFAEVHGISPGHYLYRRRLTFARERLLAKDERPNSVKDVAIQSGFLTSGQFARAYYSLFNEYPHETLAR